MGYTCAPLDIAKVDIIFIFSICFLTSAFFASFLRPPFTSSCFILNLCLSSGGHAFYLFSLSFIPFHSYTPFVGVTCFLPCSNSFYLPFVSLLPINDRYIIPQVCVYYYAYTGPRQAGTHVHVHRACTDVRGCVSEATYFPPLSQLLFPPSPSFRFFFLSFCFFLQPLCISRNLYYTYDSFHPEIFLFRHLYYLFILRLRKCWIFVSYLK